MRNYNIEEVKKEHPYQYYGSVFEHEVGDTTFLMTSALEYVVDEYDETLNSIEISHYEELGYNIVRNYNSESIIERLDLTWMNKDDIFTFYENEEHSYIREIHVNIDNMRYSTLPTDEMMFNDVRLIIYNDNSKLNILQQIKVIDAFIEQHTKCLKRGVMFLGFSPISFTILSQYVRKYGIEIIEEEPYILKYNKEENKH